MRLVALALLLAVGLTGCATKYGPMRVSGGYSETQLDKYVYRVTFKGNGLIDRETVNDYAILRCAELALENGFRYFVVIDSNSYSKVDTNTTPVVSNTQYYQFGNQVQSQTYSYGGNTSTVEKPRATLTIAVLYEKPEKLFSYDAAFLSRSLREKYGLIPAQD